MKKTIYALTGEVKTGVKDDIFRTVAIGSCVVIVAYDVKEQIGALAHIMLPGKAPDNKELQKNRYTVNALSELITTMISKGATQKNIEVCLAGGSNVLKQKNNTISQQIIDSVLKNVAKQKLEIKAQSLGGYERRSVTLNVETGCVYYTIGDGNEKVLWNFIS